MKKELVSRIVGGLLGGIVICYLITIGISISLGDGNFYPCVPSLVKRFGNEITAVIVQTILSAVLGAGFAGSSLIWEKDDWSILKQTSMKKKKYEKPSLEVVVLKQTGMLMTSGNEVLRMDYGDPIVDTWEE